MAGTAKTNAFMLGSATVMMGKPEDLFDLNPADHSVGLVKNFSMQSEPSYSELTQGVKNTIVASVMTNNAVRCSMEVYEFTAANLAWGLGLDGTGKAAIDVASTVAAEVTGDGTVNAIDVAAGDGTNFAADDFITIDINGDDNVLIRKVVSVNVDTLTLDKAFATGVTIPAGATVRKVNHIGVGSKEEQPFLAAKVVGKIYDGSQMSILIPKLRIVRGFNLAFSTDDYGNLPFEFTIFDLANTDPFYTDFGGDSARIFKA